MEHDLVFKIRSSMNDWSLTEKFINKISETYIGKCKFRIEVELTASQLLLQSMAGNGDTRDQYAQIIGDKIQRDIEHFLHPNKFLTGEEQPEP